MPFTLSHPAAALPLARLLPWATPTALAIGSMAPDFPYFIGFPDARSDTHSFASILWFGVPAGFAAYFAFERWLRAAWSDLLPRALAERVARKAPPAPLLGVLASLALGAATHVFWDSFTHEHQPGVMLVRALNVVVIELLGFPVRGYNLLQHTSTLVGAGLLAFWLHGWLKRTSRHALPLSYERAAHARRFGPLLVLGGIAPAALGFALFDAPPSARLEELRNFVSAAVVSGMSLTLAALTAYAAWWWQRCATRRLEA